MIRAASALMIATFVMGISACSNETTFDGSANSTTSAKSSTAGEAAKIGDSRGDNSAVGEAFNRVRVKQTFQANGLTGQVDIVWIIDQSGSMSSEIQLVKNNFSEFMTDVSNVAEARIALIAKSSGQYGISIGATGENRVQVQQEVGSTNALEIALNSFVPMSATLPTSVTNFTNARGKLVSFFRPNVIPIFVIVTDDNATKVNETNFTNYVKQYLNKQPRVFAFRATKSSPYYNKSTSCTVANNGTAYEQLAETTGGAVFDICQPDWKENFDRLTEGIIEAANNVFSLSAAPVGEVAVDVNGRKLAFHEYTVDGQKVTIQPAVLNAVSQNTITVEYTKAR